MLEDLVLYLPATVELAIASLLFATAVGIPLGIVAGIRHGSRIDRAVWTVSLLNASLPPSGAG
ncbi:MAG: hypothetical protein M5R40_29050 [Anaerolineae bacterium]|nr:hypothetical protein [Anaerolineae bacterium]